MPPRTNTINIRRRKNKSNQSDSTAKQPKNVLMFRISLKMNYTVMKHVTVRLSVFIIISTQIII